MTDTGELREYRKKICLLGEYAVGKSSLVRRFVNDIFDDLYIMTIGVKVTSKEVILKDKGIKFTFAIWDIGGHLDPNDVPDSYYMNTTGAIIVCDCTRKETLEKTKQWLYMLQSHSNNDIQYIVAANKCDLDRSFEEIDLKTTSEDLKAQYYYVSAKTGENVEKIFTNLAERMATTFNEVT